MLSRLIADRSTKATHTLAITIASLVFAVFAVFLLPWISGLHQVFQVIASAGSLAGIVVATEYMLIRIRARAVLGEWIYRSSSGNWARVKIGIASGGLTYRAVLYRTRDELVGGGALWAVAEGTLVAYENGSLHVRYVVKSSSPDYPIRTGFLLTEIDPAHPDTMTGFWSRTSELDSDSARGTLVFTRTIPTMDPINE